MPILNLSGASGTYYIEPGVWQVEKTNITNTIRLIGKPGAVIELQEDSVPHSSLLTLSGPSSSIINVRLTYSGTKRPKTLLRIDGVGSRVIGCDITGNDPKPIRLVCEEGEIRDDEYHEPFGVWINADNVSIWKSAIRNCFQGVASASSLSRLKIIGCTMQNLGEHGVYLAQGEDYVIKYNTIREANGCAIKTQIPERQDSDTVGIMIQRNNCESLCNHGILVTRVSAALHGISRAVRIEDNDITAYRKNSAIVVIAADGVSILRNTINSANRGLDIRSSINVDYFAQAYNGVTNPEVIS